MRWTARLLSVLCSVLAAAAGQALPASAGIPAHLTLSGQAGGCAAPSQNGPSVRCSFNIVVANTGGTPTTPPTTIINWVGDPTTLVALPAVCGVAPVALAPHIQSFCNIKEPIGAGQTLNLLIVASNIHAPCYLKDSAKVVGSGGTGLSSATDVLSRQGNCSVEQLPKGPQGPVSSHPTAGLMKQCQANSHGTDCTCNRGFHLVPGHLCAPLGTPKPQSFVGSGTIRHRLPRVPLRMLR